MIAIYYPMLLDGNEARVDEFLHAMMDWCTERDLDVSGPFRLENASSKQDPRDTVERLRWHDRLFKTGRFKRAVIAIERYREIKRSFLEDVEEDELEDARAFFFIATDPVFNDDTTDNVVTGFFANVDEGSEKIAMIFANESDRPVTWHAKRAWIKTQYAIDFVTAHVTTCEFIDHAIKKGAISSVDDRFGYYNGRDVESMLERWEEHLKQVMEIAKALQKKNYEDIVIGGTWRYTTSGNLERV